MPREPPVRNMWLVEPFLPMRIGHQQPTGNSSVGEGMRFRPFNPPSLLLRDVIEWVSTVPVSYLGTKTFTSTSTAFPSGTLRCHASAPLDSLSMGARRNKHDQPSTGNSSAASRKKKPGQVAPRQGSLPPTRQARKGWAGTPYALRRVRTSHFDIRHSTVRHSCPLVYTGTWQGPRRWFRTPLLARLPHSPWTVGNHGWVHDWARPPTGRLRQRRRSPCMSCISPAMLSAVRICWTRTRDAAADLLHQPNPSMSEHSIRDFRPL